MNYTPKEVAKIACVNIATIRRWINLRIMPSVKIGGRYYVDKYDLINFLAGGKSNNLKVRRAKHRVNKFMKGANNGN